MKKYLLIFVCVLVLFVVTGCGKSELKCRGTMTQNGVEMKAEITAQFDSDDKLVDATIVEDLENKEKADQLCTLFKTYLNPDEGIEVSCSGSKVTIKGYAKLVGSTEEGMTGRTKEEFKSAIKESTNGKVTCE